jgi:hypothetical protein
MKRLLGSWKFYVIIICLGFALWAVPELIGLFKPKPPVAIRSLNKSIPYLMVEPKTIYAEAKEWAKIIGQILTGIGGVGGAIKIMVDLFKPRRKFKSRPNKGGDYNEAKKGDGEFGDIE